MKKLYWISLAVVVIIVLFALFFSMKNSWVYQGEGKIVFPKMAIFVPNMVCNSAFSPDKNDLSEFGISGNFITLCFEESIYNTINKICFEEPIDCNVSVKGKVSKTDGGIFYLNVRDLKKI